jgi:hypothetical protein
LTSLVAFSSSSTPARGGWIDASEGSERVHGKVSESKQKAEQVAAQVNSWIAMGDEEYLAQGVAFVRRVCQVDEVHSRRLNR